MESNWRWNAYALGVGSVPVGLAARFLALPNRAYFHYFFPTQTYYGELAFAALEQMWLVNEEHYSPGVRPMPPELYPLVEPDHT